MALVVGRGRESIVYVYIVINRVKKRCALAAPKHRVFFVVFHRARVCLVRVCASGDRRRRGVVGVHLQTLMQYQHQAHFADVDVSIKRQWK